MVGICQAITSNGPLKGGKTDSPKATLVNTRSRGTVTNEALTPLSGPLKIIGQGQVPDLPKPQMIERDMTAVRDRWLDEAETAAEKRERIRSDFICYCDHDGLFADFHGLRHLFISSLERAGVTPKMAQTLARHSDIRLTLGVYTHVELDNQTAAIEALPAPPSVKKDGDDGGEVG